MKGSWYYVFFLGMMIFIEPPIINLVNSFCKNHLMTGAVPTLWLYWYSWLAVYFIGLVIAALKCKMWKTTISPKKVDEIIKEEGV